tara:strand:+ start:539 stop:688 length:150 start_codon:yes stop_codon:yes gene_type:complete
MEEMLLLHLQPQLVLVVTEVQEVVEHLVLVLPDLQKQEDLEILLPHLLL